MAAPANFSDWLAQNGQSVGSAFDRNIQRAVANSGAFRIQMAGSWLMQLANHPTTTSFERLYRKLPDSGIFAARPDQPQSIELGVYTVPQSMVLLILDWRFDIYRPNGAIVGDVVPIEDRELALSIGWDVRFSGHRSADIEYEITPAPPTTSSLAAYTSNPNPGIIPDNGPIPLASQDQFDRIRFLQTQESTDAGASLLPQRHRRDVQPQMPFTYVVEANSRVQFLSIAFQPVTIPLAFFEAEFSGLLLGANAFKDFIEGATPSAAK